MTTLLDPITLPETEEIVTDLALATVAAVVGAVLGTHVARELSRRKECCKETER